MKLYQTVQLLAQGEEWKALSLGKLLDLSALVIRTEVTETYTPFLTDKADECKAIFAWAGGDGIN